MKNNNIKQLAAAPAHQRFIIAGCADCDAATKHVIITYRNGKAHTTRYVCAVCGRYHERGGAIL